MGKVILKLDNVSYRYDDAEADDYVLKDINYSFETGKVYAIKGKSESGKTTLLSLLSGLENNYEGSIEFAGKELKNIDLDNYRSRDIGIVFQSYNLLPHLTAIENIILSMNVSNLNIANKEEQAISLMEKVGLTKNQKDRRVLKLSGGEQQRVAIARSLSYNPLMILADEPTGNLDSVTSHDVLGLLKMAARQFSQTLILITHDRDIAQLADRIVHIEDGKIIGDTRKGSDSYA